MSVIAIDTIDRFDYASPNMLRLDGLRPPGLASESTFRHDVRFHRDSLVIEGTAVPLPQGEADSVVPEAVARVSRAAQPVRYHAAAAAQHRPEPQAPSAEPEASRAEPRAPGSAGVELQACERPPAAQAAPAGAGRAYLQHEADRLDALLDWFIGCAGTAVLIPAQRAAGDLVVPQPEAERAADVVPVEAVSGEPPRRHGRDR